MRTIMAHDLFSPFWGMALYFMDQTPFFNVVIDITSSSDRYVKCSDANNMFWDFKMERVLNADGESLFRPWKVRNPRQHARRIDGVLATSIRRLKSGEDEVEVLATLHLHVDGQLRWQAKRHYARAVEHLEEASRRDWVFDAERRESALEEAERALWMARAEYLREMMR
jgi:hypothetical protein